MNNRRSPRSSRSSPGAAGDRQPSPSRARPPRAPRSTSSATASSSSTPTATRCSATRRPSATARRAHADAVVAGAHRRRCSTTRAARRARASASCSSFGPPRAVLHLHGGAARRDGDRPLGAAVFVVRRVGDPPGRERAPRLRRQREPRAQDADRRARGARRDAGRPRDDPAVTRPLAERMVQGSRAARRASSTTCSTSASSRPRSRRSATRCRSSVLVDDAVDRVRPAAVVARHRRSQVHDDADRRAGGVRPAPGRERDHQPPRQRGEVLRAGQPGRREHRAATATTVEVVGARRRHRDPEPRPRAHLRTLLPRRPGAQPRRPAAPASGSSIVRHVAQAHGGEVTVESVEGAGLDVPLRPAARSAESAAPRSTQQEIA